MAAVIVEPVQSMAGVREASPAWFKTLLNKARAAGALTIFDEVQTGMGRLGRPFAAELFDATPDVITCAKGLASGVPMGAMIASAGVAKRIPIGTLGSTFGGSPLACAALEATLAVIADEALCDRALEAEAKLRKGLVGSVVREVRGQGLLLGLNADGQAGALRQHLLEANILVGGSADPAVLRLMPPLNISDEAIDALIEAVCTFTPAPEVA